MHSGNKTPADCSSQSEGIDARLRELRILAVYAGCWVKLFMGVELDLEAHLTNLSALAHLLFVLFRRHKTGFVPAQHYANTQRMIHSIYHSVAVAQASNVAEYYLFLDSTDPLEQNFGTTRMLHGAGTQFDVVQFEDRTTSAMAIQTIHNRNHG